MFRKLFVSFMLSHFLRKTGFNKDRSRQDVWGGVEEAEDALQ